MRIFIIEDEELAGQRLQEFIHKHVPQAEVAGWKKSIKGALQWLQKEPAPDLIFSDIELLDGNVFQLYQQYPIACPIIFATAYDQYLLQAFQINGIAYLLKPFDEKQFQQALAKYNRLFQAQASPTLNASLVAQLQQALSPTFKPYKERFTIKKPNGIFLLSAEEISFITADGNLVLAIDRQGKKHPLNFKLGELEKILDPSHFFRINRSEIIRLSSIIKLESYFNDRLAVHLVGGNTPLVTSASRTAAFRKWVDN